MPSYQSSEVPGHPNRYTYYAFISYTGKDEKWARWLQKNLESYRMPSSLLKENPELPSSIRPVFWYKTDLSGTNLSAALEKELCSSRYLIVVCSPDSARSEWVNDEVECFIRQGRTDQIIPFIVSGNPDSSHSDSYCFVPALRNLPREKSLRGIDVQTFGKQHALIDVIATMFGLRFDVLWGRHRRKVIRMKILAACMAFLVLLGGLLFWEYKRDHTAYYANYVDTFGIPQGILELDAGTRSHKEHFYEFVYHRIPLGEPGFWKLRLSAVRRVNSVGVLLEDDGSQEADRFPLMVFQYNEKTGNLLKRENYDAHDILQSRYSYSAYRGIEASIVDVEAGTDDLGQGIAAISASAMSLDEAKESHAPIVRLVYVRDEKGHITRMTYHSNNDIQVESSLTCDEDRVYGIDYQLDDLGRPVVLTYLDENLNPCGQDYPFTSKHYRYSPFSYFQECSYHDESGNLVEGPNGWARFQNEIDQYGNIIKESYFDQNNQPAYFLGFHTVVYEYDSRGFLHTSYFLDVDGKPCLSQDYGFHMQKMAYNSQGYIVDDCFYDEKGKQCDSYEGFSRGTLAYDENGNITERCYYDANNKLLDPSRGYAKVKSKFDEMGNEIETFYYNANDSLCQIDGDVYAGVSHIYDKNHHPLETRYYGTDGKLIEIEEGFAIARYAYNALGNCTEVSTYDSQDRPCNRAKGYARKTAKYDYHGRITEESYFDVKGKPCNDTTGVSTKKYSYDHLGHVKVSLEKLAL